MEYHNTNGVTYHIHIQIFYPLRFFGDSRPWVVTRYCRDRSVVRWSWSSWNVWHSGTNEWKDETSQMPAGHSSQQWYEDRRGTCKDRFERTRHKMCRHQLNEWAWKNNEKVRWKYQPDCDSSCAWVMWVFLLRSERVCRPSWQMREDIDVVDL